MSYLINYFERKVSMLKASGLDSVNQFRLESCQRSSNHAAACPVNGATKQFEFERRHCG